MKNIIEDFYCGRLQPNQIRRSDDSPIPQNAQERAKLYEKFRAMLSEDAFNTYLELDAMYTAANANDDAKVFANGFRIGVLFMIAVCN